MKVLVTGRFGQVAQSLAEKARGRQNLELVALGRPELDLARPDTVRSAILGLQPDIVISAAAHTAVDQAEDDPDLAFAINARGAEAVAAAARDCHAPVIHLSTDYVFSGSAERPYTEQDPPDPINSYGRSKLVGEGLVASANPLHVILRTSWIYSPFGRNFARSMLQPMRQRSVIRVVCDQWGNPTSALDLAEAILHVVDQLARTSSPEMFGIFHLAGTGDTNWSGFARAIFEVSAEHGGPSAGVIDTVTRDYPVRAARPLNSRLESGKFRTTFGLAMPHWRTSMPAIVRRLLISGPSQAPDG